MIPAAVISKKRDGQVLTQDEICQFIAGYCQGTVPDYQMSALAMAIFFQSMTAEETGFLTQAMLDSGERLRRVSDDVPRVGKHSTGGLGDKTSLVLAPLLACFPVHVPKLSGRGLGITGGTLDKLESIPGYRTNLTQTEIEKQLLQVGCVITGATGNIVPADKKLYALRDVTGTVLPALVFTRILPSPPLFSDGRDGWPFRKCSFQCQVSRKPGMSWHLTEHACGHYGSRSISW